MTQRILKTSINECAVNVLMGWDKALKYYFMVIDYVDSDDELLYRNIDDEANISIKDNLSYFLEKARSFNIGIPKEMIARLQADKALNLGNGKSFFNEDCAEPTIKSMHKKS